MIELDIVRERGDWPDPARFEALATRAAAAAFAAAPERPADTVSVTLLLTDDAAIRELNRLWRGQDKATNVLSFPSSSPAPSDEPRHLGDVALAYETLVREAAADDKSLDDHAAHLVVHAILHLFGQDHMTDRDADRMESAEIAALATLGIPDPYREPA